MFKFSLRLCIWLALLVGSALGLVLDREPWVLASRRETIKEILVEFNIKHLDRSHVSPDNTRILVRSSDIRPFIPSHEPFTAIADKDSNLIICRLAHIPAEVECFLDNDTILGWSDVSRNQFFIVHRRFPEWWWGIFYRPLFWIAVGVFFGTVFEFVSMRKRLRMPQRPA